jgi:hypothetical protein
VSRFLARLRRCSTSSMMLVGASSSCSTAQQQQQQQHLQHGTCDKPHSHNRPSGIMHASRMKCMQAAAAANRQHIEHLLCQQNTYVHKVAVCCSISISSMCCCCCLGCTCSCDCASTAAHLISGGCFLCLLCCQQRCSVLLIPVLLSHTCATAAVERDHGNAHHACTAPDCDVQQVASCC